MKRGCARALAAAALAASAAFAKPPVVAPPEGLVLDGVPPIPAAIADALAPYGEFRPHALLSWHPQRREILVRRRLHGIDQVHRVAQPGAAPEPLTHSGEPVGEASYSPAGDSFAFTRREGGAGIHRLYRKDPVIGDVTALSPEGEDVRSFAWSPRGDRLAYAAVARAEGEHRATTTVHVVDPGRPGSDRAIARLDGGGWGELSFSEGGRRLAFVERRSAVDSRLWVMDAATGRKWRVTRADSAHPASYARPRFSEDGRALFATSDRGSEFRRLVRIPLGGGPERVLTAKIAHDVEDYDISFDAKRIAFIDNEDGADVLRFIDLAKLEELPRPPLVAGVIRGLQWRRRSQEVGFQVASARSAGDVFSYDLGANRLARWTNGNSPDLNTSAFAEPDTIRWKSFDGREMSGLYYRPPKRFTGKRPVVISIPGGAESQARPGFIGRDNYLVNELGMALVFPNVRGSSGFGKTFRRLGEGRDREGAVKDVGALLDWVAAQPDLDAHRVAVIGAGGGGFLALACAARYPERVAAASSVDGASGLAPLPAERISKPLLVAEAAVGPRVAAAQAERLVEDVRRRGTPAWLILSREDGGFARKAHADFLFYAIVQFLKTALTP